MNTKDPQAKAQEKENFLNKCPSFSLVTEEVNLGSFLFSSQDLLANGI